MVVYTTSQIDKEYIGFRIHIVAMYDSQYRSYTVKMGDISHY